jgi:hypothetical protein
MIPIQNMLNRFILLSIFLIVVLSFETASSEYSGSSEDIRLIDLIKNSSNYFVSDRSILWVEKGYLTDEETITLQQKIDSSIQNIEKYIGIDFDKKIYRKEKIEYFIHSSIKVSHTITGYQPRKYMHPVIFLAYAAEKSTPYVHETVHIIAWDWYAPWLEEGLAVFLNDALNGYPSFPNFGENIEELAPKMLRFKEALREIGLYEPPEFTSKIERRAFYILSGSFVKYLCDQFGVTKFMQIYKAEDSNKAAVNITGKKLQTLKAEWVKHITN